MFTLCFVIWPTYLLSTYKKIHLREALFVFVEIHMYIFLKDVVYPTGLELY